MPATYAPLNVDYIPQSTSKEGRRSQEIWNLVGCDPLILALEDLSYKSYVTYQQLFDLMPGGGSEVLAAYGNISAEITKVERWCYDKLAAKEGESLVPA